MVVPIPHNKVAGQAVEVNILARNLLPDPMADSVSEVTRRQRITGMLLEQEVVDGTEAEKVIRTLIPMLLMTVVVDQDSSTRLQMPAICLPDTLVCSLTAVLLQQVILTIRHRPEVRRPDMVVMDMHE